MPTTFKPVVYADNKRQDGTYNVKIRVTHRRQTLKLSTNMYVAAHQMTRALKLKDQSIIDEAKRIIDNWRAIVGRLGAAADVMTVRQVVDHIKQTEQNNMAFELDFIAYGRKKAETMRPGTGIGYQIALNALVRYIGSETLDISRINARFLTGFERFIEAEPVLTHSRKGAIRQLHKTKKGGRAVSSYLACVRHIHNLAKQEFNDEELGVIRIPQSPFKTYKVKQPPKVKKTSRQPRYTPTNNQPRRRTAPCWVNLRFHAPRSCPRLFPPVFRPCRHERSRPAILPCAAPRWRRYRLQPTKRPRAVEKTRRKCTSESNHRSRRWSRNSKTRQAHDYSGSIYTTGMATHLTER